MQNVWYCIFNLLLLTEHDRAEVLTVDKDIMKDSLKVVEGCEGDSSNESTHHLWVGPASRVGDPVHREREEEAQEKYH